MDIFVLPRAAQKVVLARVQGELSTCRSELAELGLQLRAKTDSLSGAHTHMSHQLQVSVGLQVGISRVFT